MAVAIARSVSGRPEQCHVWCTSCWLGGDVPAGEALKVAATHAASLDHLLNALDDVLFERQMEYVRDERGC
jgi:hypothetical protein